MRASPLENKTIRPGSLGAYSYYHSARKPDPTPKATPFIAARSSRLLPKKLIITMLVVVALISIPLLRGGGDSKKPAANQSNSQKAAPAAVVVTAPTKNKNKCADNTLDKLVQVSVSQRHMWACEKTKTVHDAPVITGMTAHDSTLTPPGTYTIYGKQTDTRLTGADETGTWDRPVDYWMPFLDNQHGTYGFHDATWRPSNEFGKVDPASDDASHGCVELPLNSMAWLYKWAPTGTSVTIES